MLPVLKTKAQIQQAVALQVALPEVQQAALPEAQQVELREQQVAPPEH